MIQVRVDLAMGVGLNRGRPVVAVCPQFASDRLIQAIKASGLATWGGTPAAGWQFPASTVGVLATARLVNDPDLADHEWVASDRYWERVAVAEAAHAIMHGDPDKLAPIPDACKTMAERSYQKRGFHLIDAYPALYLYWRMGVGKTFPCVAAINAYPYIQRTLILAPPAVTYVWGAELMKHTPPPQWYVEETGPKTRARRFGNIATARGVAVVANDGPVNSRVERIRTIMAQAQDWQRKFACVINYQSSYRDEMAAFLLSVDWDLCICDEGHWIKAPKGVTSKFMDRLRPRCKRRVLLSGTPMDKPHDIWGQSRFLDPSIFGSSFNRFKHEYPLGDAVTFGVDEGGFTVKGDYEVTKRCKDLQISGRGWRGKKGHWWFPGTAESAHELCIKFMDKQCVVSDEFKLACEANGVETYKRLTELDRERVIQSFQARLGTFMHHVGDDVLELPPLTMQFRAVTLGAKAQRVYADLHRYLIAEIDGGVLTAANVLARIIRLQQVTSGNVPVKYEMTFDDAKIEWAHIDDAKIDAVSEYLQCLPPEEPVVAFCRFTSDIDGVARVAEKLGREVVRLQGGINEIGAKWTDDPSTKAGRATVAIVQEQSGGAGIDLTRARHAICPSLSHSTIIHDQKIKRLHRHGQQWPVVVTNIVARGTIDEAIYHALEHKSDVCDAVLGFIRNAGQEA